MALTNIAAFPYSGSLIPSGGNNVNITTVGYSEYYFTRSGLDVTVHGSISIKPTGAGATSGELNIPIASDFTSSRQLSGSMQTSTGEIATMTASVANNRAVFEFPASSGGTIIFSYVFTYRLV